jgi:ribokinase
MPPQVIVLGSINTDLCIKTARLPKPGETVIGGTFFSVLGGKGANQGVAAARAGLSPVVFLSALGEDDAGRQALATLRQENLLLDYVCITQEHATGVAMIAIDDAGQNSIAVASGANAWLSPEQIDRVPDHVFKSAKVFLASLEVPLETVRRGLERAKSAGLFTILNPAPATDIEGIAALAPLVDLVTPNELEATALSGVNCVDPTRAETAAAVLHGRGWRSVIITLGEQGAVIDGSGVSSHIPAFLVEPLDATAAGDAFNGALAVALAEGQSLATAARFASAAAALSVTKAGAIPSLSQRRQIEEVCR